MGGLLISANVNGAVRELTESLDEIEKKVIRRSVNSALNRTSTQVKAHTAKAIAKETGLLQKQIKPHIVRYKSEFTTLETGVIITGKHLDLTEFKPKQLKKGIRAKPWGKLRTFPGSFVGTDRKGKKRVFVRKGKKARPLSVLFGPSIMVEFQRDKFFKKVASIVTKNFPIHFARDLIFNLKKQKGIL